MHRSKHPHAQAHARTGTRTNKHGHHKKGTRGGTSSCAAAGHLGTEEEVLEDDDHEQLRDGTWVRARTEGHTA